MQLSNHVDAQPVKRFPYYQGYAIHIRYCIQNVASTREWDFTAQMVWWYCACAPQRERCWAPRNMHCFSRITPNTKKQRIGSFQCITKAVSPTRVCGLHIRRLKQITDDLEWSNVGVKGWFGAQVRLPSRKYRTCVKEARNRTRPSLNDLTWLSARLWIVSTTTTTTAAEVEGSIVRVAADSGHRSLRIKQTSGWLHSADVKAKHARGNASRNIRAWKWLKPPPAPRPRR